MFSIIAAIGKKRELGMGNQLVFRIKEDMKFFKRMTLHNPVVMGRRTWESLPNKLPERKNIVVSRHNVVGADETVQDLAKFIRENSETEEEFFVIGGAMLYNELLPYAKNLYLTEVEATADADTFFPDFEKKNYQKEILGRGVDNNIEFKFVKYTRRDEDEANKKGIKMEDVVFQLINEEEKRQAEGLELIPSENYVSSAVLKAMGSVLTNKYSEGYPNFTGIGCGGCGYQDGGKCQCECSRNGECKGAEKTEKDGDRCKCGDTSSGEKCECQCSETCHCREWDETRISEEILPNYRYYGGQSNIDRIERLAIDRACRLFHADHANVQPHSGANANEAVYFAWCEPGDKILAMSLPAGGHLTHGAPVTRAAKIYNFISYGVTENGDIDYDELERQALKEQPRIILVGYSAFMKIPDFARVKKIADKIPNCLLMADMAHVAGLIAGGVHPNPLDFGFHVMTTTTHKTLRGPRGGLILSNGRVASPLKKPEKTLENIPILIDRAVFPGTQGGPLEHVIAGKAVAFYEDLQPEFHDYAKKIVENAKALANELTGLGFVLQGGGTENHLILIDMKASFGVDGKIYEKALDMVGLTLNANALPSDQKGAFRPSGVRLGTPAMTTRGLGISEMKTLAKWMKRVAEICQKAETEDNLAKFTTDLKNIHAEVKELALKFPLPR